MARTVVVRVAAARDLLKLVGDVPRGERVGEVLRVREHRQDNQTGGCAAVAEARLRVCHRHPGSPRTERETFSKRAGLGRLRLRKVPCSMRGRRTSYR